MNLRIVTNAERPELEERWGETVGPAWPEFLLARRDRERALVLGGDLEQLCSPSGRISETSYGILHDGYEYTLIFLVPPKHKDEYDFQFDDIARTFEIAD